MITTLCVPIFLMESARFLDRPALSSRLVKMRIIGFLCISVLYNHGNYNWKLSVAIELLADSLFHRSRNFK